MTDRVIDEILDRVIFSPATTLEKAVVLTAFILSDKDRDGRWFLSDDDIHWIENAYQEERIPGGAKNVLVRLVGPIGGVVFETPPTPTPQPDGNSTSRKKLSARKSLAVFAKNGYQCVHCGTREELTVDHIIPVIRGGGNDLDNLQTLCASCNSRKGARQS